jgi:16S rRNA (cytidine1402-2'-O)-methyltransferase
MVLVIAGNPNEVDLEQQKVDQLLMRLLEDLSIKSASQLAADLTGNKRKTLYQRALELQEKV